jgi:hypothetical protein
MGRGTGPSSTKAISCGGALAVCIRAGRSRKARAWHGRRARARHAAVRAYWTRQWALIDPRVEPRSFTVEADGRVAVAVHQVVHDLAGTVLRDAMVEHVYTFEGDLITSMEIR